VESQPTRGFGNGSPCEATGSHDRTARLWDPETARPLLEHYSKTDLEQLDKAFRQYVNKVVYRAYRPPDEG